MVRTRSRTCCASSVRRAVAASSRVMVGLRPRSRSFANVSSVIQIPMHAITCDAQDSDINGNAGKTYKRRKDFADEVGRKVKPNGRLL